MFTTSLKRIIRSGIQNFRRAGTVSVASVCVVTVTLSVITSLILFQSILQSSLNDLKNRVDISIYMTTDADEANILSLKDKISQLPEVSTVEYVSRDQALDNFKVKHSNDYVTLQALGELSDNPLGAILNIRAKDVSQYESISRFLSEDNPSMHSYVKDIERINYAQNKVVIERLTSMINGARSLGFAITLILSIISVIITFNTIRLAIFISREEIGVMRLVGAENKYIRGPFIVEGILYGIISSLLTLIIFIPLSIWIGNNLNDWLGVNLFHYYLANMFQIFCIILLSGLIICVLSSILAVRKYLNK